MLPNYPAKPYKPEQGRKVLKKERGRAALRAHDAELDTLRPRTLKSTLGVV